MLGYFFQITGEQTMPTQAVNQSANQAPNNPHERLKSLGITLPTPANPVAAYVATQRAGDLLFVSGQLPRQDGQVVNPGVVGRDVTVEQAHASARLCGLHILAQVEAAVGLDKVKQCVKLTGFVASMPDFNQQPMVINGTSQLLIDVLGEAGKHSRSAVGVAALPSNAPVEVEAVFLVS
jgi:enamine deaminase RidA (YjgF/YER057c/UK114 family)